MHSPIWFVQHCSSHEMRFSKHSTFLWHSHPSQRAGTGREKSLQQYFQLSIHTGLPSTSYSTLEKVYIAMGRNAGENFTCLWWLYSVLLILCLQFRTCGQLSSVNQLRTNLKKHHNIGKQMLKHSKLD